MAAGVESCPSFEQLLIQADRKGYELIDGVLVEKPSGCLSSWVGGQLLFRLSTHCDRGNLGWVMSGNAGYHCFPHRPKLVRKVEVSFVRRGRFPNDRLPQLHSPIAPDLAAEVMCPDDTAEETMERVWDYLRAGVRLIWVVYPQSRTALVFRSDGSTALLTEDQNLAGEDVVPGFVCRLAAILPSLPASPATP